VDVSVLRWLGGALGSVALLGLLARRRSGRLLARRELLAYPLALGVVVVAAFPGVADVLPQLTGFTGPLARIVSLLVFAVLGLGMWAFSLQGRLGETRERLLRLLRNVAADQVRPSAQPPAQIVVVMPALDEADNLPGVLGAAPADIEGHRVQVVVVDDGSEDGTSEVAAAHGAIPVRTPINVGGGHALQVGFLVARRLGARWVVTMDADGQHRWEDLPVVMAPLLEGRADVVVGSRRLGQSVGHERFRSVGLDLFNFLVSFLTGRRITDCSSGYRGFELQPLLKLRLVQDRHHTAELLIEAARRGLRIEEVPVTILPRVHGESKKGTNWRYGFRFARTVLSSWGRGA
jgi:hypothetical protein